MTDPQPPTLTEAEWRAAFMRHTMTVHRKTRGGTINHSRVCNECGIALPWTDWETALHLHLRDVAEQHFAAHHAQSTTTPADEPERRVGGA